MQEITLNFFQIIILIGFIYIFTYYWLPQKSTNTDEYLKLLEKYNKVLADRKFYKTKYFKATDIYANSVDTTIGKRMSAHSSTIKPRNFNQTDNYAVEQILH